jgi:hypothetical protein
MNYRVDIDQSGRGGRIRYAEHENALFFDWEFSLDGATVFVPSPDEWDARCQGDETNWAKGRRHEILERLAEEVRRQKASGSTISIEDHWIQFVF